MIRYDLSAIDVMVVDDNEFMLKLMRVILASMGVRNPRYFVDPMAALMDIPKLQPDLVITDLLMQPMDGNALTTAIRQEAPPVCYTPIFVLSGYTDRAHVLEASAAGANVVLAKPISAETLYARIVSVVENAPNFVRTESYFGPERRTESRAVSAANRLPAASMYKTA